VSLCQRLWYERPPRVKAGASDQCPLYLRKQTFIRAIGMSALCHKQTFAVPFDHLVGSGDRGGCDSEAERTTQSWSIVASPEKKSEVLGSLECTLMLNDVAGQKLAFERQAERHHVREKIGTVKNPRNGLAL
jgi:hypothetical protein